MCLDNCTEKDCNSNEPTSLCLICKRAYCDEHQDGETLLCLHCVAVEPAAYAEQVAFASAERGVAA